MALSYLVFNLLSSHSRIALSTSITPLKPSKSRFRSQLIEHATITPREEEYSNCDEWKKKMLPYKSSHSNPMKRLRQILLFLSWNQKGGKCLAEQDQKAKQRRRTMHLLFWVLVKIRFVLPQIIYLWYIYFYLRNQKQK